MASSELTKNHYILLLVLTFILYPIVLVALLFLPDTVALYFTIDFSAEATTYYTWGSKYTLLILPLPVVISGTIMIGLTWFLNKRWQAKGKGGRGGMRMFWLSVAIKLVLIAMLLWMLRASFVYTP